MASYALYKMIGVPTFLLRALKASVEIMVPAFPALAKMSWAVARKRVGNTYLKGKRVNSVDIRLTYVDSTKAIILVYHVCG